MVEIWNDISWSKMIRYHFYKKKNRGTGLGANLSFEVYDSRYHQMLHSIIRVLKVWEFLLKGKIQLHKKFILLGKDLLVYHDIIVMISWGSDLGWGTLTFILRFNCRSYALERTTCVFVGEGWSGKLDIMYWFIDWILLSWHVKGNFIYLAYWISEYVWKYGEGWGN